MSKSKALVVVTDPAWVDKSVSKLRDLHGSR